MRFAWLALVGLLASACSRGHAGAAQEPNDGGPDEGLRLVVLVVVDQLPAWSFAHDETLLNGGIRRMLDSGTYYPAAEFPYAITFTAPGHAALGTGAAPQTTGILANHWFERGLGRSRGAVEDHSAPVFQISRPGEAPATLAGGVSGRALLVEGIADRLRAHTGGIGRSVSVGLKDRAAALLTGREPDLAVWYDDTQTAMTTSTAYADAPPTWLVRLHDEHPIAPRLGWRWDPVETAALLRTTGHADAITGEASAFGLNNAFPHDLAQGAPPSKAVRATPLANEIVIETAIAALKGEHLGQDDTPDLLAVTFSAHDYAGHLWGQESWERLDMFLRLDSALAGFLDELDATVGEGRYAVVFTSDHGATPLVEHSTAQGHVAARLHHEDLSILAEAAIDRVLGAGDWVATFDASTIYLAEAVRTAPPAQRAAAMDAALAALRQVPGVRLAEAAHGLTGACDGRPDLDAIVCRSLHPDRSGDIYLGAEPLHLLTDKKYTSGTGHGSPAVHDRRVPLIISVPGQSSGVAPDPVSTLAVAPTLAALLGIPPPADANEAPLVQLR